MKLHITTALLSIVFLTNCVAQNPQSANITQTYFPDISINASTPALKKAKGYTNYTEMMDFLKALQLQFPDLVTLKFIGNSKKGLAIPQVILSNKSTNPKVNIWIQGGLHGDEPASTETVLYTLYEILNDTHQLKWLDRMNISCVPMANIDGYLKSQRNNAEGLDLNRDQTKLMAHESISLKQAYSAFQPNVALDFHEYRPYRKDFIKMGNFGVSGAYDVMLLYSGNLNVPQPIRTFTKTHFIDPTYFQLKEAGLSAHDYVTTQTHKGDIHFHQGSNNARSSVTNFALQGCMAALVEVRGVGIGKTSFQRRIFSGHLIAKTFLAQSYQHSVDILALTQHLVPEETVTITSKKLIYQDSLLFIDLDNETKTFLEVTIHDALKSVPKLQRKRPYAYGLLPEYAFLIPKIASFGYTIDTLSNETPVAVESWHVQTYKKDTEPVEKQYLQEVDTELKTETLRLPKGSFMIRTNQGKQNLLTELFEPEAPNSFISWGLIPTKLGHILPIYRIINEL
jgi:hypothetical protein